MKNKYLKLVNFKGSSINAMDSINNNQNNQGTIQKKKIQLRKNTIYLLANSVTN